MHTLKPSVTMTAQNWTGSLATYINPVEGAYPIMLALASDWTADFPTDFLDPNHLPPDVIAPLDADEEQRHSVPLAFTDPFSLLANVSSYKMTDFAKAWFEMNPKGAIKSVVSTTAMEVASSWMAFWGATEDEFTRTRLIRDVVGVRELYDHAIVHGADQYMVDRAASLGGDYDAYVPDVLAWRDVYRPYATVRSSAALALVGGVRESGPMAGIFDSSSPLSKAVISLSLLSMYLNRNPELATNPRAGAKGLTPEMLGVGDASAPGWAPFRFSFLTPALAALMPKFAQLALLRTYVSTDSIGELADVYPAFAPQMELKWELLSSLPLSVVAADMIRPFMSVNVPSPHDAGGPPNTELLRLPDVFGIPLVYKGVKTAASAPAQLAEALFGDDGMYTKLIREIDAHFSADLLTWISELAPSSWGTIGSPNFSAPVAPEPTFWLPTSIITDGARSDVAFTPMDLITGVFATPRGQSSLADDTLTWRASWTPAPLGIQLPLAYHDAPTSDLFISDRSSSGWRPTTEMGVFRPSLMPQGSSKSQVRDLPPSEQRIAQSLKISPDLWTITYAKSWEPTLKSAKDGDTDVILNTAFSNAARGRWIWPVFVNEDAGKGKGGALSLKTLPNGRSAGGVVQALPAESAGVIAAGRLVYGVANWAPVSANSASNPGFMWWELRPFEGDLSLQGPEDESYAPLIVADYNLEIPTIEGSDVSSSVLQVLGQAAKYL